MSFYDDSTLLFLAAGAVYKDGKINTIKPAAPNPRAPLLVTRGSNLTATRVDKNGLIEKGRENTQLYTNNLSNVSSNGYGSNEVTVSTSQADPFGNSEAILLTPTQINSYHRWYKLNASSIGVQTASIYVKPNGYTDLYFFSNEGNQNVTYSLIGAGSVSNTSVNTIDAKIESLSDGWYRISHTINAASVNWWGIYIGTGTAAYVGDGTSGVYFYGFQVEQGLVATEYIESGASTGKAGLLENEPRFNYPIGGGSPHLLLEPQRTNLIGYSEYFEGGNWGVGGSTGLQLRTSTPSPDGNNGVYLITSEEGNPSSRVQYNLGILGNDHIFSVFIKGTGSATRIRLRNNTSGIHSVVYDIDSSGNFTLNTESAHDGYYGAEPYGNGWHRVYLKVETNSGANNFMQIFSDILDADGSIYVWGAQAEASDYLTSYIPNHSGGSVSRESEEVQTADVSSLNLIGQNEGTFFLDFEYTGFELGEAYNWIALESENGNERVLIYKNANSTDLLVYLSANSSMVFVKGIAAIAANTRYKIAFRYDTGNQAIYLNGIQKHTSTHSYTRGSNLSRLRFNESNNPASCRVHQAIVLTSGWDNLDLAVLTGFTDYYASFSEMATALNYTIYE